MRLAAAPEQARFDLMRLALLLSLLASPAAAWDFTPGLPCLLTHEAGETRMELTYDPTGPLYTITVTRAAPFPDAPLFGMRFEGVAAGTISTDRHVLSNGGRSITVTDRGFGNVLNGLQFNDTATALIGAEAVVFSLDGASGPVAAFRQCRPVPGA